VPTRSSGARRDTLSFELRRLVEIALGQALDVIVRDSGPMTSLVVVAASDRGRTGVVVAHRYRETVDGAVVVGRPVPVGPTAPLLRRPSGLDTLGS